MFNFIISHKLKKINFINASLKRSNYKDTKKVINQFLLTLQRKLTVINAVF